MLSKIPEARNNGNYTVLKGHPWFEDFDWDSLLNGTLDPPYRPPEAKHLNEQEIQSMLKENIDINQFIKERYQDEKIKLRFN